MQLEKITCYSDAAPPTTADEKPNENENDDEVDCTGSAALNRM